MTSDREYNNLTFNIERYKITIDGKCFIGKLLNET